MFHIVEPQWGIDLLMSLHTWMMNDPKLMYWIPKFADIFVFVYPVYLMILYFRKRGTDFYKKAALFIATSTFVTLFVNLFIQLFLGKQRPNIVLGLLDEKTESILHNYLPTSSFPSDHAGLSMAIAMATLVWGIQQKDKRFFWLSLPLFMFSLIMGFCRITAAIHWPTDVLAGFVVGLVVPMVLMNRKIYNFLDRVFGWVARVV